MNSREKQVSERFGIGLRILSGIGFALMAGMIKYLNQSIPLGQVVFFRSFVALIPLVVFLMMNADFPSGLRTKHPWKHVIRCVLGTLAMFFVFAALRYLPVAEATALGYLSPVIIVVLAAILLKEYVSIRRWLGVFFGVCGLLVLTVPNFSVSADRDTLIGIGCGFISAFLIAGALLQVRELSKMGENSGAIAFYFALTSSVISAVTLCFDWQTPTLTQGLFLLGIGLSGGISQILMTVAFKYAEASAMAAYEYLSIVWAVIIGFVAFDEVPDVMFWIAMPLILLGAIIAQPRQKLASAMRKN